MSIIWQCSGDIILNKETYDRPSITKRSDTYHQFFTDH